MFGEFTSDPVSSLLKVTSCGRGHVGKFFSGDILRDDWSEDDAGETGVVSLELLILM